MLASQAADARSPGICAKPRAIRAQESPLPAKTRRDYARDREIRAKGEAGSALHGDLFGRIEDLVGSQLTGAFVALDGSVDGLLELADVAGPRIVCPRQLVEFGLREP